LGKGVTDSEADDYVSQVLVAINELYGLLYENWSIAKDVRDVRYLG
jgi:hypothetical protein